MFLRIDLHEIIAEPVKCLINTNIDVF